MTEKGTVPRTSESKSSGPAQTVTIGSWTVTVSRRDKNLSIVTNDYHPDSLVITRDELITIARLMGLKVRKRNRKKKRQLLPKH